MQVQTARKDGVTIVSIDGEIDGRTAPLLEGGLASWPGRDRVLLDLSGVSYLSSAGLRTLLLIHRRVAGENGRLILVGVAPTVADTMKVTGFLRYFVLLETQRDAVAALLEDAR
jgi:anti-sigma B factor antagonist